MQSFLMDFSETHRILAYLIIFIGILIEGEIVLVLAGVLSRNGYLDFFDIIFFSFIAAVIHDLIYWGIGRKIAARFGGNAAPKGKFLFFKLEKIIGFLESLKRGNGLYIFISKFVWNLNRVVLVASGYMKTPFKKLLSYSVPASLIWSITFVSLGYIFAHKTNILHQDIKTAAIFISVFILVIIVFEDALRRTLKKDIKKEI
ncbi:MAG: hypothetical protein AAB516_01030 [Patescibacteria group bacterium]